MITDPFLTPKDEGLKLISKVSLPDGGITNVGVVVARAVFAGGGPGDF